MVLPTVRQQERELMEALSQGNVRGRFFAAVTLIVLITAIVIKGAFFQFFTYALPLVIILLPRSRYNLERLFRPFAPPILLLFVVLVLPSLWAWAQGRPVLWGDLITWFWKLALFPIALAILLINSGLDIAGRNAWVLLGGAIVAVTGIYDAALFSVDMGAFKPSNWPRFDGIASNPNPFGLACALGSTSGVVHLLASGRSGLARRSFFFFLLILCICGVLLSGSRGALVVFMVCSTLAYLVARQGRLMGRSFLLIFFSVLLLFGTAEQFGMRVFDRMADTLSSDGARFEIWSYYLTVAKHNLGGLGLIDPREVLSPPWNFMPHNFLLELMVMGGVLAVMVGVGIASYILWSGWRLELPETALFLGAIVFASVDMSLFDSIPMEAALMLGLSLFHAARFEALAGIDGAYQRT